MDLPEASGGLEALAGDQESVAASQNEARTDDDITVTVTPASSNIEAEREEANKQIQAPASEAGSATGRAEFEVLAQCDIPPEHMWQVAAEEAEAAQRMLTRRAEKSSQTETLMDDLGRSCTYCSLVSIIKTAYIL